VVADRLGHDVVVLMRSYAQRTKKADKTLDEDISNMGILNG